MTIEPVTKPEVPYTEAPASRNVSYVTPEGFISRITLRSENDGAWCNDKQQK